MEESGAALVDVDEGLKEDDDIEETRDRSAEREPEHIEGLDPAGERLHLSGWRGCARVGRGRFGARGKEARDPREEGNVDYHEGADVEVGENVSGCVGDLKRVESVMRLYKIISVRAQQGRQSRCFILESLFLSSSEDEDMIDLHHSHSRPGPQSLAYQHRQAREVHV